MLTRMHPQLAAFFSYRLEQQVLLQQMEESGTVIPAPDIKGLRHWYRLFSQRVGGAVLPVAEIRNLVADTDERPIGLRLYRPLPAPPAPASAALSPALIYFHGGGWTTGDLDTHDRLCRRIAIATQAIVIAVDYALAPELPWPQAPHDCIATTRWVLRHAESLGINPTQIGVAGDSAGGNLAAVVAQVTLDDSVPPPTVQTLIYPAVEASLSKPSHALFAEGFGLTRSDMVWYRDMYLPDRSTWELPTVSPLLASSLDGLAPAVVATAGFDPLRDEGDAYAERLADADVPVRWRCYDDMIHGFFGMGVIPECLAMATEVARATGERLHAG